MTSPDSMAACDLCCDTSEIWAFGFCDHATCLTCSARIRLLCGTKDCPVCRKHLDKVLVVKQVQPFAKLAPLARTWRSDRRNGFIFQTPKLMDLYHRLKSFECVLCVPPATFHTFKQLREHVSKTHELYYCDICVQNLKLFPREFKTYSRQELTLHRREGDPDNKSHRGHPLCEFCDDRFFDNDTLYSHLRKLHFWCHICESDGKQDFYPDYRLLRVHFRKDHFLCEEGDCKEEKFTTVFRSKIDIQAHRAATHTKGLSKSEAKQLRQIDVGFTYASGGGGGGGEAGGRRGGVASGGFTTVRRGPRAQEREAEDLATALSTSLCIHASESRKKKTSPKNDRKRRSPVDNAPTQPEPKTEHTPVNNDRAKPERPPGFNSEPPMSRLMSSQRSADMEWPDLHVSVGPSQPPRAKPYTIVEFDSAMGHTPVPGQAAPQRSVVISGNTAPRNRVSGGSGNSNLLRLMDSTSQLGGGGFPSSQAPPPGFSQSAPLLGSQVSGSGPQTDLRTVEIQVIKNVRRVLDNDQAKFMQFKTLSGWYRNSEISAAEYVKQCSELFGDTWSDVGPQIAHVMPIEEKRRELLSLFDCPAALDGGAKKKRKGKGSKVSAAYGGGGALQWPRGGGGGGGTYPMLSEDDYPSLRSAAGRSGSGKMPGPWNGRVSTCI